MAGSQRSVPVALVVAVAVVALLAAGRWLQPQLGGGRPNAPATTSPAPSTPEPTSPGPASPTLATGRPAGPSPISRVVATSSPVDAIAVTRRAVWLAVGGLVLRVDPATGRALVVPEVEDGAPVVDLVAGAGAVWAVTSAAGLLRIDPRTARLTVPNPGPVSAVAASAGGVWAVCCQGRGRRGRVTRLDPASGRVIATAGLPGRPLAVGAGPGGVWVRGAEGWLWRVDPASGRQAGALRLPTIPGSAELAGEVVVAGAVIWVSDPGVAAVRRIDPRRRAQVTWEADGRDLALTAGGTVWATSGAGLLGLGGRQILGPRRNLHELGPDRITAVAAATDGGLWLGAAKGLFHADPSILSQR
jgi:streptogramin lyase